MQKRNINTGGITMAATMFVKHRINDFKAWKLIYDGLGSVRKDNGVTEASVYRDPEDPGLVFVVHQFKDMNAATRFANSGELKSAMAKAGVDGPPEFWFGEDVEHTPH
jgi:quinol monooxygenase YgiN